MVLSFSESPLPSCSLLLTEKPQTTLLSRPKESIVLDLLDELEVECFRKNEGCWWHGPRGESARHADRCPHRPVACTFKLDGCEWSGQSSVKAAHEASCRFADVSCELKHLGCTWQDKQAALSQHLSFCRYAPVKCSFCSTTCLRLELTKHKCMRDPANFYAEEISLFADIRTNWATTCVLDMNLPSLSSNLRSSTIHDHKAETKASPSSSFSSSASSSSSSSSLPSSSSSSSSFSSSSFLSSDAEYSQVVKLCVTDTVFYLPSSTFSQFPNSLFAKLYTSAQAKKRNSKSSKKLSELALVRNSRLYSVIVPWLSRFLCAFLTRLVHPVVFLFSGKFSPTEHFFTMRLELLQEAKYLHLPELASALLVMSPLTSRIRREQSDLRSLPSIVVYADFSSLTFDKRTSFNSSKLEHLDFRLATFIGVDFSFGSISHCDFSGATFLDCNFLRTQITDCCFVDASFTRVNMSGDSSHSPTTLSNSIFSGVDLSDVDLSHTIVKRCLFYSAKLPAVLNTTQFERCNLALVDFRSFKLADGSCSFEECDLTGANLSGPNLRGVVFKKANLTGVIRRKPTIGFSLLLSRFSPCSPDLCIPLVQAHVRFLIHYQSGLK